MTITSNRFLPFSDPERWLCSGNGGRGTFSSALNYPVGNSGFGCCGFHIPTQDFINNFKTLNGLPFDS